MRSSWRLSELAWCKRWTNSPAGFGGGFCEWFGHTLSDGVAHAGNRNKMERFLDAAPIVLRYENGIGTLAGNLNGFVRIGGLIEKLVKFGTGLCDGKRGHAYDVRESVRVVNRAAPAAAARARDPALVRIRLEALPPGRRSSSQRSCTSNGFDRSVNAQEGLEPLSGWTRWLEPSRQRQRGARRRWKIQTSAGSFGAMKFNTSRASRTARSASSLSGSITSPG